MTFEEYKNWVKSRVRHEKARVEETNRNYYGAGVDEPNPTTLTLGGLALVTEAGEVGDLIKKYVFHGKSFEEVAPKLKLEMGDVLWYYALICREMGWTLQEIMDANVEKLDARDGKNGERFHDRIV